jgi:hypothetical protein
MARVQRVKRFQNCQSRGAVSVCPGPAHISILSNEIFLFTFEQSGYVS